MAAPGFDSIETYRHGACLAAISEVLKTESSVLPPDWPVMRIGHVGDRCACALCHVGRQRTSSDGICRAAVAGEQAVATTSARLGMVAHTLARGSAEFLA